MKRTDVFNLYVRGAGLALVCLLSACSSDPGVPIDLAQPSPQSIAREEERSSGSMDDLDSETLLSKAAAFKKQGRANDALFYYVTFLEREPESSAVLAAVGHIHLEKRNWDLAKTALEMSIKADPEQSEVLESLGLIALRQKDLTAAERYLTKAKSVNPHSVRALSTSALLEDQRNDHIKARVHYEEALKIDPTNAGIRNNLAYSLCLANQCEKALAVANEALRLAPNHEGILMNRGLFLMKLGRTDEAMTNFRRFMNEADANNNMGFLSMENGNYPLAREYLEKAIRSSPSYHELAHRNLKKLGELVDREMPVPEQVKWASLKP